MKPLRLLIILLAGYWLTSAATCRAQNLVPNPSFEEYSECPDYLSLFDLANDWYTPSDGTTDLFNTCSQFYVGIPTNYLGYQFPRTGNGYAGIHPYVTFFPGYREYLQVKLIQPLRKDSVYHVEFYVSLANNYSIAISNLGAYFSVSPPGASGYGLLNNVIRPPQVRNSSGYLTDTLNWVKVEGNFMAAGGEQYLTIGNFDNDAHTRAINPNQATAAYYYIDDVSVEISTCPIITNLGPDLVLCPGDSLRLDATSPKASYRWQDGSTQAFYPVKAPGTYWVDVQLADCIFRDSIRIEYLSQLPGDRFRDTTICWNQGLHLDAAFPGVISYIWEDGTTGPDKHIYYAGTYWVDLFFGGCTYRDSLTVRFTEALDLLPDHVYLCAGEPVVLNATLEGATYTWPDGSTGPTFTVSEAGFYWVIIQAGKCTYQEYVYVNHAYAPQVFYEDRISLCRGETRLLDVSWVNGPYRWQDGSRESYFLVTRPGTYRVEYTWAGCPVYDSITVEYTDEYPPLLPRQIAFCEGETRLLNAYSPDIWYYHWQDGSYNSTLRVSQPGTYWVDYFRGNCLIRDSVTVSFLPTPALTIRNDTVLCYGKSLTLQAAGDNQSFRWSDGTVGAELTVKAPGTYWVEARDLTTGCLNRQTIRIQQTECWEDLNIPNLITPNGDEFNQFFVIEGLSDHWNLEIMNRWGKPVYQTRAYRNNWDAAGHPSGAYYYRLWNYVSGQTYQGWLQVLR